MCRVTELKTGETACAYNLEEVKRLFLADSELAMFRAAEPLRLQEMHELQLQLVSRKTQLDAYMNINLRLQQRIDTLTQERLACDKDLQDERAKPSFGPILAWSIAGVALAVAAGAILATRL